MDLSNFDINHPKYNAAIKVNLDYSKMKLFLFQKKNKLFDCNRNFTLYYSITTLVRVLLRVLIEVVAKILNTQLVMIFTQVL